MARQSAESRFDPGTFGTVLLALLFGFTAWMVVKQRDSLQMVMRVPVRPTGVNETIDVRLDQKSLPVLFTYPKSAEMFMREGTFWIELDLGTAVRRLHPGEEPAQKESLSTSDIKRDRDVPPTIVPVIFTEESRVDWSIRLRSVDLKVEPDVRGEPAPGHIADLDQVYVEPTTVAVALTEAMELKFNEGSPLPTLKTGPVDISDATGMTSREVDILYPVDGGILELPNEPIKRVVVTVPIQEQLAEERIEGVSVTYVPLLASRRAEVEPRTIVVVARGPRSVVSQLKASDFVVALRDVEEDIDLPQEVEVLVTLPEARRMGKPVTVAAETKKVLVRVHRVADAPASEGAPEVLPNDSATSPTITSE